jgi:hypothetical protein
MTGTRIGNWVLGVEVGRGPLGVTYRANANGETVAVRLLSPEAVREPGKIGGELLALRRLAHPNLAGFLEAGVHAGQAYVVRAWAEGLDLATFVKANLAADSWREFALPLAVQLARALNHGHRRSLLHRRVTPGNVIVSPTGQVTVTDFGLGKFIPVAPLALSPDPWAGLAFLPPELFTGKPFTRKSDLYSLGAILYAAVTGRPPYTAASPAEYLHKHCYVLPDRPSSFVPKLPAEFDDLICALLAKDPTRRPAAAAEVLDELDRIRGKLERKGDRVPWPADPGDTSLHAPLSETAIAESQGEQPAHDRPRPLFARPWLVLPLLLAVVAAILVVLFRPGPTAAEYYERATALLATGNPDDADTAWDDCLEPLQRKYPGAYADEIAALRNRRTTGRDLIKALDQGQKARFGGESERLYYRGLALARVGEFAEAKQIWESIRTVTDGGDRWADAANRALQELAKRVR